jgi:hypothetical protein
MVYDMTTDLTTDYVMHRYGEEELRLVLTEEDYKALSEKYDGRLKIEARLSLKVMNIGLRL